MKRRTLLIFLTLIILLFLSTKCFANNEIKNDIQNASNTVMNGTENIVNDVKNGIENTGDAVEQGAKNIGSTIFNGMNNMMNTENNMQNDRQNNLQGNTYQAARTAVTEVTDTDVLNTNIWTWVALAVAGIVIVGLVWYYATEHDIER